MPTRFLKISSNGNKILKYKLMTAPYYMIIFDFSFLFSIVEEKLEWLSENQEASTEEFNEAKKAIEEVAQPIIAKMYQQGQGQEGQQEPHEHDDSEL